MQFWVIAGIVALLVIVEQVVARIKGRGIPGPSWIPPLVGRLFSMILAPWDFYANQAKLGPISWNSVASMFFVHISDADLTRKVFSGADQLRMWMIFGAKRILGDYNIAFLHGTAHKELRVQLLPLFNRRALASYIPIQEETILKHLQMWYAEDGALSTKQGGGDVFGAIRNRIRDLNVDTSLSVFVGPYLTDDVRKTLSHLYFVMNEGMLCFPVYFPGTTLYSAVQARKKIIPILTVCARQARERMEKGEEPRCLLDYWMVEQISIIKEKGTCPHSEHEEVAHTVIDFLFASQDASTSSLVWTLQLLADYPHVLRRVREEVDHAVARPGQPDRPITHQLMDELPFTRQVVKEILRYRPPASFVPHIAVQDYKIKDDYVIPKGSIIFPSIESASKTGYPNANEFEPDRFGPERQEDLKYAKYFLVFGSGAHACLGREYAVNHITCFTALFARLVSWEHKITKDSQEIIFGPTIYPADGCLVSLKPREIPSSA